MYSQVENLRAEAPKIGPRDFAPTGCFAQSLSDLPGPNLALTFGIMSERNIIPWWVENYFPKFQNYRSLNESSPLRAVI